MIRLALAICAAISFFPICASGERILNGDEYLQRSTFLRANSRLISDISGTLSGTMKSGTDLCAVLITHEMPYVVRVGSNELPPMGASVRALVKSPEGSDSAYALHGWAFASDVVRAATKPPASTRPAAPTRNYGSRGGPRQTATDHTSYYEAYARAIKGLNSRLSDADVNKLTKVLLTTCAEYDVDPRLMMAIILAESGFNPSATSYKGAMGLGQLMPGTARGMGVTDAYDIEQNVAASIKIIRSGLSKYSGNARFEELKPEHIQLALAAYNAGSGAVRKYGGVPPYRETRSYIAKVSAYYKQLCGSK